MNYPPPGPYPAGDSRAAVANEAVALVREARVLIFQARQRIGDAKGVGVAIAAELAALADELAALEAAGKAGE